LEFIERVKTLDAVVIDPFFVVDAERAIVHFNRAFHSLLPRATARGLKGKNIDNVISYDLEGHSGCIVRTCWAAGKHLRLDEIKGLISGMDRPSTFILSALPFFESNGNPIGAMVVQRDVTGEADVQTKYQEMLDNARTEREELKELIRARTKTLLETHRQLIAAQRELMDHKRGRII
jgi:PAS domain-containing protein